jgi:hypothetical protein
MTQSNRMIFQSPDREEWRLPDRVETDTITGDTYVRVIRHRDGDLPAIITTGGYKAYYKFGLRHRDSDLPAIDYDDFKCWYKEGKLHRDNGLPAEVFSNGEKRYWVDGVRVK